ncbi:MAG: DUF4199 domain-containing protein [Bacteroidia bacterium]|nr:DUF4199 domain-containing protein [Bacteroidia bacterium]
MEKIQIRAITNRAAMYYGAFLGIFLIVRFLVEVLTIDSVAGSFVVSFLFMLLPVIAYIFTLRFTRQSKIEDITFGTLFRFCFFMFFFASLFLVVVQYIFYRFIQPDYLSLQFAELITNIDAILAEMPQIAPYKEMIVEFGTPTASQIAVQSIWIYSVVGVLFGLPIAGIVKSIHKKNY